MKQSYVTVTDQFCGAGGSSLGARAAGAEVFLALNHWQLAIATHNTNFPTTRHDCTDISACDPRRYPSTDILITSPECTNHTLAKGVRRRTAQLDLFSGTGTGSAPDPAEDRSRATMWDVPRFAEYHRYEIIIVENVVDARHWLLWDAWLHAMHLLGYRWQIVYFNSMFAHPTPQSRDRLYAVFWRAGNRAPDLRFTPAAWCARCNQQIQAVQAWKRPDRAWGKYGKSGQYWYRCPQCAEIVHPAYYAAANAIDWTLPTPRIGDRPRPLKDKTLKRIRVGLEQFAGEPLILGVVGPTGQRRATGVTAPLPTQTGSNHRALVTPPFIVDVGYTGDRRVQPVTAALPTQTGRQEKALVVPPPFLLSMHKDYDVRSVSDPLSTVAAGGNHHFMVEPRPRPPEGRHPASGGGGDPAHPFGASGASGAVRVEDCGFRMLQPHEIQAAMAFPSEYTVLGTTREKVKQLGNAVTPPVMHLLLERCIATLAG